jgi:gliding motility-associated-like protein
VKDKDYIKEGFKERFESFEAPVDGKLWAGIESQIGTGASSTWLGMSKGLLASVAVVAVVGSVIGFNAFNSDETEVTGQVAAVTVKTEEAAEEVVQNSVAELKANENLAENESTETAPMTELNTENGNINTASVESSEIIEEETEKKLEPTQPELALEQNDIKPTNEVVVDAVSNAPKEIVVSEQSRAMANPSGGVAPLTVNLSSVSEVSEIKWKFDDGTESSEISPSHVYEEPGIYFVTMLAKLSDGSMVMDKAVIEVKENMLKEDRFTEESSVFIPNVFTPNNDGENDELIIKAQGVHSFTISIYSVNGKLVYQNSNPEQNWNGNDLTGKRVEDGTYYYLINAIGNDQRIHTPKGYITVRGKQ